jgi:hypothetical protein
MPRSSSFMGVNLPFVVLDVEDEWSWMVHPAARGRLLRNRASFPRLRQKTWRNRDYLAQTSGPGRRGWDDVQHGVDGGQTHREVIPRGDDLPTRCYRTIRTSATPAR